GQCLADERLELAPDGGESLQLERQSVHPDSKWNAVVATIVGHGEEGVARRCMERRDRHAWQHTASRIGDGTVHRRVLCERNCRKEKEHRREEPIPRGHQSPPRVTCEGRLACPPKRETRRRDCVRVSGAKQRHLVRIVRIVRIVLWRPTRTFKRPERSKRPYNERRKLTRFWLSVALNGALAPEAPLKFLMTSVASPVCALMASTILLNLPSCRKNSR